MNKLLISHEVERYLRNFQGSPADLALKGSAFKGISSAELAQQFKGLVTSRKKFPTLYEQEGIVYPPGINLEQTSSETAARYKASLFPGARVADLTGGFGIDSLAFSDHFSQVIHIETNPELSALSAHNFRVLGKDNVQSIQGMFQEVLPDGNYDLIYLDPSRRHAHKGKVFQLTDYEPNPIELLPALLERTDVVMIKTSPLLDLSLGIKQLKQVAEIHVVSVNNEVKELLWVLRPVSDRIKVASVNLKVDTKEQYISYWGEKPDVPLAEPSGYLYEPNAAILKAGSQDNLAHELALSKLNPFTQLYTADKMIADFPGRVLKITQSFIYGKKSYGTLKKLERAEVITRNFPLTVKEIRAKFRIKDGGDQYWYFAGGLDGKNWAMQCERLK